MSNPSKLKFVAVWVALPFIIGCLLSTFFISEETIDDLIAPIVASLKGRRLTTDLKETEDASSPLISDKCDRRFQELLGVTKEESFESLPVVLHRNGESDSCGQTGSELDFLEELRKNYVSFTQGNCPSSLNKYQVETLLTTTLYKMVNTCPSTEKGANKQRGLLGFCDMGPKKTVILRDHQDLVPVVSAGNRTSLPCRFHTREGLRITELSQLTQIEQVPTQCINEEDETCSVEETNTAGIHLYAVPAGRVFMFAPSYVGEIFHLPHVSGADDKAIYLEVLSLSPRVFDVFNFFSREESQELVDRAIAEQSESHRIKRSSTGASGYNINSRRTSESGFDTHGKTATKIKKRCFKALGFDEYLESHGDGLQILRYNVTTAYNSHLDWIEDTTGQLEHDYESGGTGGNRFATILLYMSDLGPEDGGETVFPKGWPPNVAPEDRLDQRMVLERLKASDRGSVLNSGSWEENLVVQCRTRLSVRPHSSRAVLFYSQFPNGNVDPASLHGACPVLSGTKYAANLWVWNTPRTGFKGAPVKEKFREKKKKKSVASSPSTDFVKIHAVFRNDSRDPAMKNAKLYFGKDRFWGNLGHGDSELALNTYTGHQWNIMVDDKIVKSWTISDEDGTSQEFTI